MEGLIRIANCESSERVCDLVFVHGLDGDAISTWHPIDDRKSFWPEWLGQDFPNVGIWSLGYAVSASAWKSHSMPLTDRATNTLDLLELDGFGKRPIVFVCHSLGGLLVKQTLRDAFDSKDFLIRAIANQTKVIVFLSTPHSGADLASWVKHIGTILRSTVSVGELEAHHPRLRDLNTWYRNHVDDLGVTTFVYCEKLPTKGILVVNETTADPGIAGVKPVPLDDDHISICKPADRQSQVYRRVSRLIEGVIQESEQHAELPPVDRQIQETGGSEVPLRLRLIDEEDSQLPKSPLLHDLEQAMTGGVLRNSELAEDVLKTLQVEGELELVTHFDSRWIVTAILASDAYFALIWQSAGVRDWQRDFAKIATPIVVGVAWSLQRSPDAQAVVTRLCNVVASRLRLNLVWPDDPDEANDLKNAIYRTCLDASELECDDVLAQLQVLPVIGP